MVAYYNEWDRKTASWLRVLIDRNLIAPGLVDERSITDVHPSDLAGFSQCHFFAGIGGWSYALRLAGVPDDYPCWTGSPPCQPFSVAGKQRGISDERHLAPAFINLIKQCSPSILFGEQVAAAIRKHWLDDLFNELENEGYTCGAAVLPACSIGAPHKRERLFFGAHQLANTMRPEWDREPLYRSPQGDGSQSQRTPTEPSGCRDSGELAYTNHQRFQRQRPENASKGWKGSDVRSSGLCDGTGSGRMDNAQCNGRHERRQRDNKEYERQLFDAARENDGQDPNYRFWGSADWISFRDGKFRAVEPGSFPLANGIPARVGRLRGYGNAIVPQIAAEFIRSYFDAMNDFHT